MRRVVLAVSLLAGCSGEQSPAPEAARALAPTHEADSREVAEPAEKAEEIEPEPPLRPVETAAGRGETQDSLQARPTAPPPPAEGELPAKPDSDAPAPPPVEANLDPEHLQQVREQDMDERERRAQRARAARKAYEQ